MPEKINIPCATKPALCEDDANPFENLSSEGPDGLLVVARTRSFTFFAPPLGTQWVAQGCLSTCVAETEEEARLCAEAQSLECTVAQQPPDETFQLTLVENDPQECTRTCPDGLPFTWFVPAGTFHGFSKHEANTRAHQHACQMANTLKICLSDLKVQPCLGKPYDEKIFVSSLFPVEVSLLSGTFPEGLELEIGEDNNIRIFGTPTESGQFEFVLRVTDELSSFFDKRYDLVVGEFDLFTFSGIQISALFADQPAEGFSREATFGTCGGVVRASAECPEDIEGPLRREWIVTGDAAIAKMLESVEPGHAVPFNVRVRGQGFNGHYWKILIPVIHTSGQIALLQLEQNHYDLVGVRNYNVFTDGRIVTGLTALPSPAVFPNSDGAWAFPVGDINHRRIWIFFGVEVRPGQCVSSIDLDVTIERREGEELVFNDVTGTWS